MKTTAFLFLMAISCSLSAQEWKEMDEFHMVMAESFHPYMDSSNLQPAKAMAVDMAEQARVWIKAERPQKMKNGAADELFTALLTQTSEFASCVKQGKKTDDELGDMLHEIHETFHHLMDLWYKRE